jgi:hypothetical protein
VSSNKLHIEQFQAMTTSYFRTKPNYSCINNSESHTIKGVNLSNKHIPNNLPINISRHITSAHVTDGATQEYTMQYIIINIRKTVNDNNS